MNDTAPPSQEPSRREQRRIFQTLDKTAAYPYARREYVRRALWNLVQATLFRFSPPKAVRWRRWLLRLFGAKMAPHAGTRGSARIFHPWLFELGDWSMLGPRVVVYNLGPVRIGNHSVVSQEATEDIAIFRAMPGVVTIAPADAVELRGAMRAMMETPGPMYLRVTRDPSPTIFPADYRFQIGPGVLLRDGTEVGLIGTGVETTRALEAADRLADEGIAAAVLHLPTLKPIAVDAIVALAERTGRIVTAEDHSIIGGLGSAVAEVLGEHHPTPMRRVGLMDVYGESAPNDYLLEAYGISATHIAKAARELFVAG